MFWISQENLFNNFSGPTEIIYEYNRDKKYFA